MNAVYPYESLVYSNAVKKPVHVTLYSAGECHLCHEMEALVREAAGLRPLEIEVIDISGRDDLEARWRSEIPVLFIQGRKAFKYRAELASLLRKIDAPP
jgi:alkyl hydroperoxide reductase subunit AhpF